MRQRISLPVLFGLIAALVATALVYSPGLTGGFVFDDFPNIVDNAGIHVTHSTLANWANAAWASPSSQFKRPLASLTFAANWYFSGGNPWPMKATNIGIHLLNGLLLYFMLRELLRAWRARRGEGTIDEAAARRLALAVTAGWLLLPINLMAVLYVVQRMESLCQVFVLAGLWAYLHGRNRMLAATDARGERAGFAFATAGLILGTFLGLLSKESAVLLPVYAFLAEWIVAGFRARAQRVDRRVAALFVCVLLIPTVLGLAWLAPRIFNPAAWDGRDFTLPQRLLSEARILVDYLHWTVLPDPVTLSLYHDQIRISTGLLAPWTTLASILLLAALLALALGLRRRAPLLALGILWFFAGQLLTATIVPLELVYEHRNYFASIGVLLALFSLLLGLRRQIALPIVRGTLAIVLLMWFAGVTFLRAQDWSNPLRLALAEADHHPDSPRANYEAGRLLIIASDYAPGKTLEAAKVYLQRSAALPGSSTLPEQALIMVTDHAAHGDDAAFWRSMTAKLRNQPTKQEDISALISLAQCRVKGDCHFDVAPLQQAYLAALSRPNPIARLYGAYSDFARELLEDRRAAIRAMRTAVAKDPHETAYRVQLAYMLEQDGQMQEAERQIQALRRMDALGRLDAQIRVLERGAARGTTHDGGEQ